MCICALATLTLLIRNQFLGLYFSNKFHLLESILLISILYQSFTPVPCNNYKFFTALSKFNESISMNTFISKIRKLHFSMITITLISGQQKSRRVTKPLQRIQVLSRHLGTVLLEQLVVASTPAQEIQYSILYSHI